MLSCQWTLPNHTVCFQYSSFIVKNIQQQYLLFISDAENNLQPKLSLKICQSIGGHYYVEGETWKMDACTTCVCHDGHVLCSTHSCPPLPCTTPVHIPGACCPSCPGKEKQSFMMSIICIMSTVMAFAGYVIGLSVLSLSSGSGVAGLGMVCETYD